MPRRPDPLPRLYRTATRLGITVLDRTAAILWPDESTAAVVGFGEHIVLNLGIDDDALHADLLAMALIVAAVMGDCPSGHPCAIAAPSGVVLISRTRVPLPVRGPGLLATLLARQCGRDTASAAFEYAVPAARMTTAPHRWPLADPRVRATLPIAWLPASGQQERDGSQRAPIASMLPLTGHARTGDRHW